MAKVSWLLPVRDGLPFLTAALESIAQQTYDDHEVLAWDNGSRDGSLELLRDWIPARIPGRVFDRPLGLGASLAALVEESGSELIARLDADDTCVPTRLADQVAALEGHPDHVGVVSGARVIGVGGVPTGQVFSPPADPAELRWSLFFGNPICHSAVCLRRAAVLEAGNYRDFAPGQDHDLWLRLVRRGPLLVLGDLHTDYRRHDGSLTAGLSAQLRSASLRRIAAENAPSLFPGVDPADCMQVWEHLSAHGLAEGAPSLRVLERMVRAAGGLEESHLEQRLLRLLDRAAS